MATRKRVSKQRRTRRKGSARTMLGMRFERELPRRVGDYVNEVQKLLDRFEREFQRASQRTRAEASRLLRQASRQLTTIETRGQSNWQRLVSRYRGEAARMLRALEGAIAPARAGIRTRKAMPRRASRRTSRTRTARKR